MPDGVTITINAATANAAQQLEKFFGGINQSLDKLTGASDFLQGLATQVAAAFTLDKIVEEFRRAINSAEEFGKAVQKTGVSLNTLAEAKLLGVQKDLGFEQITNAIGIFNDRLFMAQRLGGQAARPFYDLGLATNAAELAALNGETAWRKYMDAIAAMPDGQNKVGLAMELTGRNAREMIPFLNEGSAGLDKFHDAASKMIDDDTVRQATQFNISLREMHDAFDQIFLDASKQILPILQDLVAWLKSTETSTHGEVTASEALVEIFKVLATVASDVKSVFVILGAALGDELAMDMTIIVNLVTELVDQFQIWWNWIKQVTSALVDMIKAGADAGRVIKDLLNRDFGAAAADASAAMTRISGDFKKMGSATADAWKQSGDSLLNTIQTTADQGAAIWHQFTGTVMSEADSFTGALNSIWGAHPAGPAAAAAAKSAGSGAAGASPAGGVVANIPLISQEGQKLIDEIDKNYTKATQVKLERLDAERDDLLHRLDLEVADVATREAEKNKVIASFAQQRQDLMDAIDARAAANDRKKIQDQLQQLAKDPNLTGLQKAAQARNLLNIQLEATDIDADATRRRAANAADPEKRLELEGKLNDILAKRADIERQIQAIESSQSFSGSTVTNLTKLQTEWGNLAHNMAGGVTQGIVAAVHGVGTAIMDTLEKTKSWGQVFAQIGRQIIGNLIDIVVEWVANMTIVAALKAAFATADNAQASAAAAKWAPAAIAASIATSGSAAIAGLAGFVASLVTGTALAAGFETGGVVHGGPQIIRVNESGTEAVLNARAVNYLGHDFINSVNAGAANVAGLHDAVSSGLTRPITETGLTGGAGGTVVQGHKMSVAFVNSRSEMRDYLNSSEGERHIVDIARRNRMQLGVQT